MLTLATDVLKYKNANGEMEEISAVIGVQDTDATLSQSGTPADAKAVGDKFNKLSNDIDDLQKLLEDDEDKIITTDTSLTQSDVPADAKAVGDKINEIINNGVNIEVDESLDSNSTNAVQNKVIKAAIDAVYGYVDNQIDAAIADSY